MLPRFPALAPSEHPTITAGRFPHVAKRATGGRSGRIRLGNAQLDAEIKLFYTNVDTSALLLLKSHWERVRGTTRDFSLPADLFPSLDTGTRARLMATAWRFKEPPTVVDFCGGAPGFLLHSIEIALRSQPRRVLSPVPEDAPEFGLPVVPRRAPGARFAVFTTWAGGRAGINTIFAPGAELAITVIFAGGTQVPGEPARAPGGAWNVTATWESVGRTAPGAPWNVTAAFAAGRAGVDGLAPGAALNAIAAFSGGAASVPLQLAPGAALAVTATWAPGAGSITGGTAPGAALAVSAGWVGGTAQGIGPGAALAVTATWLGGAASGGPDPFFGYVSLLLHLDTDFTDSSQQAHTMTLGSTAAAAINNVNPRYGAGSVFIDSHTDQFTTPRTESFNMGTEDFTIEWASLLTTTSNGQRGLFHFPNAGSGLGRLWLGVTGFDTHDWTISDGLSNYTTLGGCTPGVYQRCALVRSNGTVRFYVEGAQLGPSVSFATNMDTSEIEFGSTFGLGRWYGNIDEIRVTAGIARYTSNYNPTGPFPNQGPAIGSTATFTNSSAITIPSSGKAVPYPSAIEVTGHSGKIIHSVSVSLTGLSHQFPTDLELLLVGPTGAKVLLMADQGGTTSVSNVNLTIQDNASSDMNSPLVSGTYRPSPRSSPNTSFASPAPASPYNTRLSTFINTAPEGTWNLYVYDDANGNTGSISGGWALTLNFTS